MLYLAVVLFAAVLVLVGKLLLWSPGNPRLFLDDNGRLSAGSISEKTFIAINGVKQGMFIKGKNVANPVLLYLHGGLPDYFLTQRYPIGLEDDFTVVWWEMRGSGLSYDPGAPLESITTDQLISDTLALTDYLRDRFDKERVYLMGHSGGTFIGLYAAARSPERYHAYIGVAQVSNQLESEMLAYEYMLEKFRAKGNTDMARKLEAAAVTKAGGTPREYLSLRDTAMHSLGIGTTHNIKSVLTGIFLPSWRFPEYTLGEKVNLWRGKFQSGVSSIWDEMITTDLTAEIVTLDVPTYFVSGIYDYTVNYTLAREFLEELEAPVKGFYTFQDSAHSPIFEEPEWMQQILQEDVLTGRNRLADDVSTS